MQAYEEYLKDSLGQEKFDSLTQEQKSELFEASKEPWVTLTAFQEMLSESIESLLAPFTPDPFEGRAILLVWQSSSGKPYDRNHPFVSKKKKR
ncbi:MAG: hypothetical protein WA800_14600 [Terriglobales bacterium]